MSVIKKQTLWEGKFLRTVIIDYMDNREVNGIVRKWEAIERINISGVVGIVPFTNEGEVLLIRQFRPPVNGHVVELPAGLVDKGETFEEAALRELREETGYEAGKIRFLTRGPMSSGASSEILDVYVVTDLTFIGVGQRDESEDIEVLKVPVDHLKAELERLSKAGNLVDLKVFGLVEMARRLL